MALLRLAALHLCLLTLNSLLHANAELKVFTFAPEATDGHERFMRSAALRGIEVEVLGTDQQLASAYVKTLSVGGQKLSLLREALRAHTSKRNNEVVMFADSYNSLLVSTAHEIVNKFTKQYSTAQVVFAAEPFCRHENAVCESYPTVKGNKRTVYLNAGVYIGYASSLLQLLDAYSLTDVSDDQLFFTLLYLDTSVRTAYKLWLDTTSLLFEILEGTAKDLVIRYASDGDAYVYNIRTGSRPAVLHAHESSKLELNALANYVPGMYSSTGECLHCREGQVQLAELDDELPVVHVALLVVRHTPFVDEFFEHIAALRYPRSLMRVFVADVVEAHRDAVERFAAAYGAEYDVFERIGSTWLCGKEEDGHRQIDCEWRVRATVVERCANEARYYLQVDGHVHLENRDSLRSLIKQNRTWLTPVISRPNSLWSNFWGAVSPSGFYVRSDDYALIVQRERVGMWNVPFVSDVLLVQASVLRNTLRRAYDQRERAALSAALGDNPQLMLAYFARQNGVFMWITNVVQYGHLVNNDDAPQHGVRHPDLFERDRNRLDWEQRYVHPGYWRYRQEGVTLADFQQPCPDVFWFPFVSTLFAQHLVDECNHYGKWSDGSNQDARLEGGYENVPTRDIHMRQIGFEEHWLNMLSDYVRPVAEILFSGYHSKAHAIMNFVVRYKPEEQPSLRPHHDSSTYTLNVALNRRGIDFQGGGSHFLRYNCSVLPPPDRVGWTVIHPGRLTHQHEGLPTTNGTRYIMVSFVDP